MLPGDSFYGNVNAKIDALSISEFQNGQVGVYSYSRTKLLYLYRFIATFSPAIPSRRPRLAKHHNLPDGSGRDPDSRIRLPLALTDKSYPIRLLP